MAIFCSNCGTQLPDDSQFCFRCGKPPRGTTSASQENAPAYPPTVYSSPAYGNSYNDAPVPYINDVYPPSSSPGSPSSPGSSGYSQQPAPTPPQAQYAQYAPPQQGMGYAPAMPPAPTPKRNRTTLWIIAAIVVVIVIAIAGGVFIYNANQPTAAKTLSAFCNDLQSGNYADSYTLLSNNISGKGTQSQWDAGLTTAFNAKKGITSCSTSNVNASNSTATGDMLLKYGDGTNETDKVTLTDENGKWKVSNLVNVSNS